jgi:poly-gamma-glutamate capsule biosynthesis protein CapA/YwtB (metallophosphatase superfamily)
MDHRIIYRIIGFQFSPKAQTLGPGWKMGNAEPAITNFRTLPSITIFLSGDVMTGRGIDQVLPIPGNPSLHESFIKDSRDYVRLAEMANGPIPRSVSPAYIWGDALDELEKASPDLRIINLETSITISDDYWEGKGVNYRMHPGNIPSIKAAGIDLCVLANNHVLDWGYQGLAETLDTLRQEKISYSGAGRNSEEAEAPTDMEVKEKGRIIVFSVGSPTSGIPLDWAAAKNMPGINLVERLSEEAVHNIANKVRPLKRQGDIVIASIHWGSNWGYQVPFEEVDFAHNLINHAGVDLVYGHSSHHVKGIEVYGNKLILYGCGDFLDDYEGIRGFGEFRGDLGLMYFVEADPSTGNIIGLKRYRRRSEISG